MPVSAEPLSAPFDRTSEAQSENLPGYLWPPHLYREKPRIAKGIGTSQTKASQMPFYRQGCEGNVNLMLTLAKVLRALRDFLHQVWEMHSWVSGRFVSLP